MQERRVFLLSPAYCGGERAQLVLNPRAQFPLARRLQTEGEKLGNVFAFLSGLYFRGKLAYAMAFGRPPRGLSGALVITPTRGIVAAETVVTIADLREFAEVDIHENDARYRVPLERDAKALARRKTDVVLLGSIASDKYIDVLVDIFGDRLRFPPAFVGRGDMSRGGLLLRCVDAMQELEYAPVAGAVRHGPRPERLAPRRWRRV